MTCSVSDCEMGNCPSCEMNRWVEAHACQWCDQLLTDSMLWHSVNGKRFCGKYDDSLCAHLFFELMARR